MIFLQILQIVRIILIALGACMIIFSIFNFLHFNSAFLLSKFARETLSESERAKYQKSLAVPYALLGVGVLILSIFLLDRSSIYFFGYFACLWVYIIWVAGINKKYLGTSAPLWIRRK